MQRTRLRQHAQLDDGHGHLEVTFRQRAARAPEHHHPLPILLAHGPALAETHLRRPTFFLI